MKAVLSSLMTLALSLSLLHTLTSPAQACLSCGCSGSGSAADMSSLGGASSLFSKDQKWLLQVGGSFRQTLGSFNERGQWNPMPTDSLIQSYQLQLGVMFFPTQDWSVGLQLPVQGNLLSGAAWGPFGSVNPTDLPTTFGLSVGDLQLQTSYKFLEFNEMAVAGWLNATLPTGVSQGDPQYLSGLGIPSASAGLLGIYKPAEQWEVFANLGYSRPLGTPNPSSNPFFVGDALLYQLQANWQFAEQWRVGLGINGLLGQWTAGEQHQLASRVKLVPSVQYEIDMYSGLRLGVGYDLPVLGSNSLTEASAMLVFYQYLP